MVRIGVLSDTHLYSSSDGYQQAVNEAFTRCEIIIHAGDITDVSVLDIFQDKELFAVHGNMCNRTTQQQLPAKQQVNIRGYSFGICHGAGPKANIEERMIELFPTADCIVYGHTHSPACHWYGETLILNPGSFQATGAYGAPGTYAIITITADGLKGKIHTLNRNYLI